jgi:hypothetical protein
MRTTKATKQPRYGTVQNCSLWPSCQEERLSLFQSALVGRPYTLQPTGSLAQGFPEQGREQTVKNNAE